ncbi:MAG TPA: divalent metal cation transporter [Actinomycetales bacterium]|nr:divalent metal cation transporter [Actinomycetales bacterium]
MLTFIAEIGGVALSLELATSVWECFWVPFTAAAVWIVLWRAKFDLIENAFGLLGLSLIVFSVALWQLGPDWSGLWHAAATAAKPKPEAWPSYWYYAVALFGAAMTPYEVFIFSSAGVEEKWDQDYLPMMRANVLVGFSLGALLSVSIAGVATVTLLPASIQVDTLGQVGTTGCGRPREGRARDRHSWFLRRHLRGSLRNRTLARLQNRSVHRMAVGQARAASSGGSLPRRRLAVHDPRRGIATVITLHVSRRTADVDGFETWMRDRVIAATPPGTGPAPHREQSTGIGATIFSGCTSSSQTAATATRSPTYALSAVTESAAR